MPIKELVLVVGAGASTNLGVPEPLPLMQQWNNILRAALDTRQPGLSELVGLRQNQPGPDFEAAIGEFLAWQRIIDSAAKFLPFGLDQTERVIDDVKHWRHRAQARADLVVEALNETLYDNFGGQKISRQAARDAYGALIDAIQLGPDTPLTVVTTNYDPAVERAFAELNRRPDAGDVQGPGGGRWLQPDTLIERSRAAKGTPVLHLHGKVGWYTQEDGSVRVDSDDQRFNASSGTPTVLMPDPEKDPLAEPSIRTLWEQFDVALSRASHILVLGHSLHDPVLVQHLNDGAARGQLVMITHLEGAPEDEVLRLQHLMNRAETRPIVFGPEPQFADMVTWANRAPH